LPQDVKATMAVLSCTHLYSNNQESSGRGKGGEEEEVGKVQYRGP